MRNEEKRGWAWDSTGAYRWLCMAGRCGGFGVTADMRGLVAALDLALESQRSRVTTLQVMYAVQCDAVHCLPLRVWADGQRSEERDRPGRGP